MSVDSSVDLVLRIPCIRDLHTFDLRLNAGLS